MVGSNRDGHLFRIFGHQFHHTHPLHFQKSELELQLGDVLRLEEEIGLLLVHCPYPKFES